MKIKIKFLVYIAIAIAAYTVIIIFIILPTMDEITEISDSIFNERVDLERKYLKGQLLKKTIRDFDKIKDQDEKLTSVFVTEGEELEFITLLEAKANVFNIDQEIDIKEASNNQKIPNLSLQITINGNYLNALEYINVIERLPYYFNVSNVQISSFGQQGNGKVKIILIGNIYIRKSNT